VTDEEVSEVEKRLRLAYATALNLRHASAGRVEIHIAQNVLDYLRSFLVKYQYGDSSTMWGFPLVVEESAPFNYVAVHTVEVII
jgi:hypothetical protein